MHESGLVQNLISEVQRLTERHGPLASVRVILEPGGPVTAAALQTHWDVLTGGTSVEGVALEIGESNGGTGSSPGGVFLVSVTTI